MIRYWLRLSNSNYIALIAPQNKCKASFSNCLTVVCLHCFQMQAVPSFEVVPKSNATSLFRRVISDVFGWMNPYMIIVMSKSARDQYLKFYSCKKQETKPPNRRTDAKNKADNAGKVTVFVIKPADQVKSNV